MNRPIARPVFSENQILGSADVNSIVNHSRDSDARHHRNLHSWGIADGLVLRAEEREDAGGKYVEVLVSPGIAIDGTGREIVVTEDFRLSEDLFDQLNVAVSDAEALYPVMLLGRDQVQKSSAFSSSVCAAAQPTRTEESFEVIFGRVGDATELHKQIVPEVSEGLTSSSSWKVLLGYVKWDGSHFSAVATEDSGVSPRYAGVIADDVMARADRLSLRSADRNLADKAALEIDNQNDGEMRFGLQDDQGNVVPVFTVNAKGDVKAEGKILGGIAGGVQIESGVITDGALVPLPVGVTQQLINDGGATIQIHLSPRFQQPASLPFLALPAYWIMQPLECYADGRRVVCLVRWEASDGSATLVMPGVCDYQVFAFVSE